MRNLTALTACGLIFAAVLFVAAGLAVADDTACQLIRTDAERQILSLCGPSAVDPALSLPLDPDVRTMVAFRVVPDGMRYLRQVPDDARITNIALAGVCVSDADLAFVCERFPALMGLAIRVESTIRDDELEDLSPEQREELRQSTISPAALRQLVNLKQLRQLNPIPFNGA